MKKFFIYFLSINLLLFFNISTLNFYSLNFIGVNHAMAKEDANSRANPTVSHAIAINREIEGSVKIRGTHVSLMDSFCIASNDQEFVNTIMDNSPTLGDGENTEFMFEHLVPVANPKNKKLKIRHNQLENFRGIRQLFINEGKRLEASGTNIDSFKKAGRLVGIEQPSKYIPFCDAGYTCRKYEGNFRHMDNVMIKHDGEGLKISGLTANGLEFKVDQKGPENGFNDAQKGLPGYIYTENDQDNLEGFLNGIKCSKSTDCYSGICTPQSKRGLGENYSIPPKVVYENWDTLIYSKIKPVDQPVTMNVYVNCDADLTENCLCNGENITEGCFCNGEQNSPEGCVDPTTVGQMTFDLCTEQLTENCLCNGENIPEGCYCDGEENSPTGCVDPPGSVVNDQPESDGPRYSEQMYCQPARICLRSATSHNEELIHDDDYCENGLVATETAGSKFCVSPPDLALEQHDTYPVIEVDEKTCKISMFEKYIDGPKEDEEVVIDGDFCTIPNKYTRKSCEIAGGVWNLVQVKSSKFSRFLLGLEWLWSSADVDNVVNSDKDILYGDNEKKILLSPYLKRLGDTLKEFRTAIALDRIARLQESVGEAMENINQGKEADSELRGIQLNFFRKMKENALMESAMWVNMYGLDHLEENARNHILDRAIQSQVGDYSVENFSDLKEINEGASEAMVQTDKQGRKYFKDHSWDEYDEASDLSCKGDFSMANDTEGEIESCSTRGGTDEFICEYMISDRNCVQDTVYMITDDHFHSHLAHLNSGFYINKPMSEE